MAVKRAKRHKNWKRLYPRFRRLVRIKKAEKRWRSEHRKKGNGQPKNASEEEARFVEYLKKVFPGYQHEIAPKNFSLINNETSTLSFLNRIKEHYDHGEKTLVRLDKVKEMTTDAIVVLLSNMKKFQASDIGFEGTKPTDDKIKIKLENSGFFDHLYRKKEAEKDQYTFREIDNHIYTHSQKTVAAAEMDNLMKQVSRTVWGQPRRCQGAQKTLVELMHNTYDHADKTKGGKHWWLSVEQDKFTHEVTFSFIDFGVGIFRSLKNKAPDEPLYGLWDSIKSKFPKHNEAEILRLIMEGQIVRSQSRKYYRGKGLSKIYTLCKENKISSLSIISNYSSMNTDRDDFHLLDNEFMGTFISFKINQNTVSLSWTI